MGLTDFITGGSPSSRPDRTYLVDAVSLNFERPTIVAEASGANSSSRSWPLRSCLETPEADVEQHPPLHHPTHLGHVCQPRTETGLDNIYSWPRVWEFVCVEVTSEHMPLLLVAV